MRKALAVAVMIGGIAFAGAGTASADATAEGIAADSPGVLSGNLIQVPVDIPVNVCGNSINVIGLLNPSFGNTCVNVGGSSASPVTHHFTWQHHPSWHHFGWQPEAADDDCP
ncbi:chaplin [Streptacidiphilus sp. MAP12-16]|uniref:chaplin n=1 Tax=Streptacidiphilus sp. MAP12-16 TaxID=3156300 RepID=UPI00351981BA